MNIDDRYQLLVVENQILFSIGFNPITITLLILYGEQKCLLLKLESTERSLTTAKAKENQSTST